VTELLVTGAAGFVGASFIHDLLERGQSNFNILGIDDFSAGYKERLPKKNDRFKFMEMDVFNLSELQGGVDVLVHCAAIAPLPECQVNPVRAVEQNVGQCASIIEYCRRTGTRNIIFFSSGAIYEGRKGSCTEKDPITTSLVYPTTKYMAENYFRAMSSAYGINIVALRLFNLYGPRQDYFRKQPPLVGYLLRKMLSDEEVCLFASENARRDYIYISDLTNLMLKIIGFMSDNSRKSMFMPVNVGSGCDYNVYEIYEKIKNITGSRSKLRKGIQKNFWSKYPEIFSGHIPLPVDVLLAEIEKEAICDNSFAKGFFDWSPVVTMEMGLEECIKYAKELI